MKYLPFIFLTACSGAPFSVMETSGALASPPEAAAPLPVEASASDTSEASVSESAPAEASTPPPVVEADAGVDSGVEAAAAPPPPVGTLCCRMPGPSDCISGAPPVNYPCGTTLGGWIYSVETTGADGKIHVADIDCTYGPPTTANIGLTCRWPMGSTPSTANCGDIGAIEKCGP